MQPDWEASTSRDQTSAILMIIGSLIFGTGAQVGVPKVFTERDPNTRLRLLEQGLTAWRFRTYVLLTIGGLILLGVDFLIEGLPIWLGWLIIGASIVFLAAYLRFSDIPPFVFYVLLLVAGVALLISR